LLFQATKKSLETLSEVGK